MARSVLECVGQAERDTAFDGGVMPRTSLAPAKAASRPPQSKTLSRLWNAPSQQGRYYLNIRPHGPDYSQK